MAVVWVTRTNGERTAKAVEALGHEAIVAPVLATQAVDADLGTARFDAVIFTSRNGVSAFADQADRRDCPAWCVGDATAEAARQAGFSNVLSAEGDVQALFEKLKVEAQRGTCFLYASAREPSAPLTAWLWAEGFSVSQVPVYETAVITPAIADVDLGRITNVLIHSARAGKALAAFVTAHSKFAFTNSCFICMSEAAWQGFSGAFASEGIKRRISPYPDEPSMLKLIDTDAF